MTLVRSGLSAASFTDTGLTGGTYFYKVSATLSGSESALSNEASATASDFTLSASPTTLTIAAGKSGTSAITVTPLGGFSGTASLTGSYTAYGVTTSKTSVGAGSPAPFPITTARATPPGTYTTVVTGIAYDITGTASHPTSIKVTVTPAPAPTNLAATAGLTRVKLTWTGEAGATYTVYRSTSAGAEVKSQSGISGTSFTDSGLTGGVTYFYKVSATVETSESLLSTEVSATPTDFTLAANPTTVTVQVGSSATTSVSVSPLGGFAGSVSLSGSASGITAGPATASPGVPASLPISAGGSATPGTYPLDVTGTASDALGSVSHTTPMTVIVAPPLAVHVIWTSDATTSPVTQQASTSGQIGGNAVVHLSLPLPPTATSAVISSVVIHENAAPDASQDITATNLSLFDSADPLCDPPPGLPAGWIVNCANIAWPLGGRNGPYTITVQSQTTNGGATIPQTQTLTVDREDLIVSVSKPTDPAPIVLTPNGSASLSVSLQAAYKTRATVTVQIFASDQTPVRTLTYPSAAFPSPVIVGGSTASAPLTLTWDGSKDDGTPADRGVYLYRVSVSAPNGDGDIDKSTSLFLSSPTVYADAISDNGKIAVYKVYYTLTSTDSPQIAAMKGQIDVFDLTRTKIYTQQLALSDLIPGNHSVTLTMPSSDLGPEKFLISAIDGDAAKDKAGRSRYALQHNNNWKQADKTIAFCWAGGPVGAKFTTATQSATDFKDAMGNLGYKRLPGYTYGTFGSGDSAYDWWYGDPNVNDVAGRWDNTQPLSSSNKRIGALNVDLNHIKLLKTVFFGGHGSADGAVLELRGPDTTVPSSDTQTFLVATQAYYDAKDASGKFLYPYLRNTQNPTKSVMIDTDVYPAVSGASPLGNLDLVILSGCSQSISTPGVVSLGQAFSNSGAKCVLMVGDSYQDSKIAASFIKSFLGKLNSMTLYAAYLATKGEYSGYNGEGHASGSENFATVNASIQFLGADFKLATH